MPLNVRLVSQRSTTLFTQRINSSTLGMIRINVPACDLSDNVLIVTPECNVITPKLCAHWSSGTLKSIRCPICWNHP